MNKVYRKHAQTNDKQCLPGFIKKISQYRLLKIFCLIAIVSLFLFMPLCLAFEHMLSCYDDVGYAIIAKNVANGIGYATTINYVGSDFTISPFNFAVGQGPVGILPVALVFRLFGINPLWPGLTQVGLEFLLLVSISLFLLKKYDFIRIAAFLGISLSLITLISGWCYEHWYAMLGESLSALFVLLGFIFLEQGEESPRYGLLSGLFLGFSVLTKEISAIFVISIGTYCGINLLISFLRHREKLGRRVRSFVCFCIAGVTPFLAFESWRLATLGWHGFFANWHEHLMFISSYSPPYHAQQTAFANIIKRSDIFKEHYYIQPWIAFFLVFVSIVLCCFPAKEKKGPILALGCGIIAYFVYWIFFSTGPARHLYIGIIILCFFICFPVLKLQRFGFGLLPALVMLLFLVPRGGHLFVERVTEVGRYLTSAHNEAAYATELRMLAYIKTNYAQSKILTPWWAHVAMLEFLSPRGAHFSGWDPLKHESMSLVVVNSKVFALSTDEIQRDAVILKENMCTQLYISTPYTLYSCKNNLPAQP